MGLGLKWSTTALMGAAAGVGAALARARRPRVAQIPPRQALGVDGLGVDTPDTGSGPLLIAPSPEAGGPPPSAAAADAVRALDEARDRLRRRADELAREMDGPRD